MADDLSLLFRLKGDASGAVKATADTRIAVAQLRTSLGGEFNQIQKAGQTALTGVGNSLQNFVSQRIPLVGNALSQLTPQFGELASESTAAGASIGAMALPIGLAVTAVIALHAAALTLAQQFLALTISTAQWEGKLFDLSQQTGVSVETLSTLSALAEDTGGSIEGISQSLVIFQGNIEDAQDSTSKMGQKFADLGISTDNTEQALRDAIKALAAMDEGLKQTNAATELFGRRGGKQFLAILKESHGDIDTVREKLRALNSLVTTDVARGADQLNDQLNATRRQFQGLQAQIVNESMPLIVRALQDLSRILRENREVFILLGQAIGLFIQGNLRLIAPAVTIASLAFDGHRRALAPLIEMYERFAAVLQIVSGRLPSVDPNAIPAIGAPPTVFNPGATRGAATQILSAANRPRGAGSGRGGGGKQQADLLGDLLATQQRQLQDLTSDSGTYTKAVDAVSDALARQGRVLSSLQQTQLLQARANAASLEAAQKEKQKREELARIQEDAVRWLRELNREVSDAADNTDEYDQKLRGFLERLSAIGQKFNENTRALIERNIFFARTAELTRQNSQFLETYTGEVEDLHAKLVEFLDPKGSGAAYLQWLRDIGQAIKDADAKNTIDALNRAMGERIEAKVGPAPPPMVLKGEGEEDARTEMQKLFDLANENLTGATQVAAIAGLEALTEAFSGLAQAVGSAVEAWVLYGNAGTSIRKVTAQILAAVAAQAAVKAIFELAEGFAALARMWFGDPKAGAEAAAHFKAAAIYGVVAGAAAIAGRAVAGDAFKQSSGSGGSGGAGGSSGGGQSAKPGTTDVNRNALPQTQPLKAEITLRLASGLHQVIEGSVVENWTTNGRIRTVIKSDGQG